VIEEHIGHSFLSRNDKIYGCAQYPLRKANSGGHIDTVKLLLDSGTLGNGVEQHVDGYYRDLATMNTSRFTRFCEIIFSERQR